MTLRQRFNDFIDDYDRNLRLYNRDMSEVSKRLDKLENPPKPEKLHQFYVRFRDPRQTPVTIKAVNWLGRGSFYSFDGADGHVVLTVRADDVLSITDAGEVEN